MERKKMMKNLTAKERYLVMKEVAPFYEEFLPDYQYSSSEFESHQKRD